MEVDASQLRELRGHREALAGALARWEARVGPLVQGGMQEFIRSRQKSFGRTGQLSASVRIRRLGVGALEVGPEVSYAPFVDQPTRPHEIRPRFKKALAFAGPLGRRGTTRTGKAFQVVRFGGKEVRRGAIFAQVVHHPGTKGMFFIEGTKRIVEGQVQRILDEEVTAAFASLDRGGA